MDAVYTALPELVLVSTVSLPTLEETEDIAKYICANTEKDNLVYSSGEGGEGHSYDRWPIRGNDHTAGDQTQTTVMTRQHIQFSRKKNRLISKSEDQFCNGYV